MSFKLLAIKVLKGNHPSIKKVLQEGWFLFNQSYEVVKDKDRKEILKKNDKYSLPDDFFGKNITVSAIVGKNGSGKTSVLDLMIRIINNFTYFLVKDLPRNGAEPFYFIEGVYADLYFTINNKIGIVHCRDKFVGFTFDNRYKFGFSNSDNSVPKEFSSYTIKSNVDNSEFIEIAKLFFYTIVTNYALQAYLDSDYKEENCSNYEANGKSDSDSTAIWINSLFHKNDGYSAPIVLNPYRDKGVFDASNESQLTQQRLVALLIESKNNKKQFIDDYQLNNIVYKYSPTNILRKFKQENDCNELHRKLMEAWYHDNDTSETYTSVILNEYGFTFSTKMSEQQQDAYLYLIHKTLNIASKYPSYDSFNEIAKGPIFCRSINNETSEQLKKLVQQIKNDNSHITLKIRQTLNFLNKCNTQQWNSDFTYADYISTLSLSQKLSTLTEIMDFLPPPFFDYDIKLDKVKDENIVSGINNPIPFQILSSGEKQFLYAVSTMIYHIKNLCSVSEEGRVKYRKINLVLDEIELCFHPEYQRLFVKKLIDIFDRLNLTDECMFNIILSTHSPFILSDIPKCNVMFLKEGKQVNEMQEDTFGANIHSLMQNAFFLTGTIGEFAKEKINKMFKRLYDGDIDDKLYTEIKLVSEPFLRSQLLKLYNELVPNKELRKEIDDLKAELKTLKEQINDKDRSK
jgi:hypothetical protein